MDESLRFVERERPVDLVLDRELARWARVIVLLLAGLSGATACGLMGLLAGMLGSGDNLVMGVRALAACGAVGALAAGFGMMLVMGGWKRVAEEGEG